MTEREKTSALIELIDKLCEPAFTRNETNITEAITKLNKIYANDFRHNYADLFFHLQCIFSKDPDVAECLGENLNVLESTIGEVLQKNPDDANIKNTSVCFKKFADHIRLEIGRYNFIKQNFAPISGAPAKNMFLSPSDCSVGDEIKNEVKQLQGAVDAIRPVATQAQKELDKLDEKLESNKISSITTLTIFSAVVLAFSGGITFEAGMLQGMASASPYRLVFTIALTGFVLFNTLFAMLYLVGKLSGKTISTRCRYLGHKHDDFDRCQSCGDGYCTKAYNPVSVACRIKHKYSYILVVNVVLLWVMYGDFVMWLFKETTFSVMTLGHILIPAGMMIIIGLVGIIRKYVYRQRLIVACKVKLISGLVEPKSKTTTLLATLATFLSKTVGDGSELLQTKYLKVISKFDADSFGDYQKMLKATTDFVVENMLTPLEMSRFISADQHWHNKRTWKKYKKALRAYHASNGETQNHQ